VIAPSGEEIFFSHKQSACGGWLDVDMNVSGETTKPVENIRWSKGEAPRGKYKVFLQNFRYHSDASFPTHWQMEVEVNGVVKQFKGTLPGNGPTGNESNHLVYEFVFDGSKNDEITEKDYAAYSDDTVLSQWRSVLPPQNILTIDDAHTILDVMLGAIALQEGYSYDQFMNDLKERESSQNRRDQIGKTLDGLKRSGSSGVNLNSDDSGPSRGGSVRL
jgi:hypothetical protein